VGTTTPQKEMSMSVSAALIRRLAFARYVVRNAEHQSKLAHPANAVALLSLQDAVELFLVIACGHRDVPLKQNASFQDYLSGLRASYGEDVPFAAAIHRLNKARVSLKHYGIMPHSADVLDFANVAKDFLSANSKKALGVNFERVSLSDLIVDDEVRGRVEEASERIAGAAFGFAIDLCLLAMHRIRMTNHPYRRSAREGWRQSPDDRVQRWSHPQATRSRTREKPDRAVTELSTDVQRMGQDFAVAIRLLSEQIDVLTLGFDWPEFRRFRGLGSCDDMGDGSVVVNGNTAYSDNGDAAQFALDFVIDAGLRLQPGPRSTQSATDDSQATSRSEGGAVTLDQITLSHPTGQQRHLQTVQLRSGASEYRDISNQRLVRIHRFTDPELTRVRLAAGVESSVRAGWIADAPPSTVTSTLDSE
jgi:hypothetical protein